MKKRVRRNRKWTHLVYESEIRKTNGEANLGLSLNKHASLSGSWKQRRTRGNRTGAPLLRCARRSCICAERAFSVGLIILATLHTPPLPRPSKRLMSAPHYLQTTPACLASCLSNGVGSPRRSGSLIAGWKQTGAREM